MGLNRADGNSRVFLREGEEPHSPPIERKGFHWKKLIARNSPLKGMCPRGGAYLWMKGAVVTWRTTNITLFLPAWTNGNDLYKYSTRSHLPLAATVDKRTPLLFFPNTSAWHLYVFT